jgi:hypothetical protein
MFKALKFYPLSSEVFALRPVYKFVALKCRSVDS